jgi:hypothetical protein
MTEVLPLVSEINHVINNLKSWMKIKDKRNPIYLFPCSSYHLF